MGLQYLGLQDKQCPIFHIIHSTEQLMCMFLTAHRRRVEGLKYDA
uniref:Uncharacterized protein n=1 Tax=Arundo donax TaxID=35708 RepID=A0A0A9BAT8_ARUDO